MARRIKPKPAAAASPDGWVRISERQLVNLDIAVKTGMSGDMIGFIGLLTIESILKGLLWQRHDWQDWPAKGDRKYKFLYTHRLDAMAERAAILPGLVADPKRRASWQTLRSFDRDDIYLDSETSRKEALDMAVAVRHPEKAVYPWLKHQYLERWKS